MSDSGGTALREPAHRVSPRAKSYWRVTALIGDVVLLVIATTTYAVLPERPWWATVLLALLCVGLLVHLLVMPQVRFEVHRWEVTDTAVHTREGWIGRHSRIAPISRVQTIDSKQGAIMRLFGLASLTVTTASAAGPISIDCLEEETARRLVAQLTAITAATEGDAT